MKILNMTKSIRPITVLLLPILMIFLLGGTAFGQERQDAKGKIENAQWKVSGDVVVITYDLVSDTAISYEVHVTLTRESNRSFKLVPKSATGAVGKGKFAGSRMEIRWEYKKDVPEGLEGDDYSFEFVVNVIREEGGGSNWLYYVGGVGLAGVAAAVLLGGKKESAASSTGTTGQLPTPPYQRPPSQ